MPSPYRPTREQLLVATKEAAGQITAGLAFTVVVYLLVTVASTTDEMLLRASPMRMPVLDLQLPLAPFFKITPLLILGLHYGLLVKTADLRRKARALQRSSHSWWSEWGLLLPSSGLWAGREGDLLSRLVSLNAFIWIIMPVALLLEMEWRFLPYRAPTSYLHAAYVSVDLFLLVLFLWLVPRWDEEPEWRRGWRMPPFRRPREVILAVGVVCVAIVAWGMLGVESLHRLDVRGRLLVAAEPAPELLAAQLAACDTEEEVKARLETVLRDHSKGLDLSGRDLRGADFTGSKLYNVKLRGADLTDADLTNANLAGGDLNPLGFEAWDGSLYDAGQERHDLLPELDNPRFRKTRLVRADLRGAVLSRTEALMAVLDDACLNRANLEGSQLMGVSLQRARLEGGVRLTGVDLFAAELNQARLSRAYLQGAVLRGANLIGADLRKADLRAVDLSYSLLDLARLNGAKLQATEWQYARVLAADLSGAELQFASRLLPQEAILRGANAAGADLCGQQAAQSSDDNADSTPSRPLFTLMDLRGLRSSPKPDWTLDTLKPLKSVLSADAWTRFRERRHEPPVPCLPESGNRKALPSSGASPADVDAFYEEIARRLIAEVCQMDVTTLSKEDRALARAVRTRLWDLDPLDAVSQGLQKRVEEFGRTPCSLLRRPEASTPDAEDEQSWCS